MGKGIRRVAAAAALSVFLLSIAAVGRILYRYHRDGEAYREAEERFAHISGAVDTAGEEWKETQEQGDEASPEAQGASGGTLVPPLVVDFGALEQVNGDVAGWLYCEDTPINYPVVKGEDNSYYLKHSYDGKQVKSGSIFVDAACGEGFSDANTVIYGHYIKDGSMFACLKKWGDQSFYEEHPRIWLLTPEADYEIVLFAGYVTRADSQVYTIFSAPCPELEEYLQTARENSQFQADVEISGEEPNAKYVVLSTCAYSFQNARYVLHGKLVPADR